MFLINAVPPFRGKDGTEKHTDMTLLLNHSKSYGQGHQMRRKVHVESHYFLGQILGNF